MLKRALWGAAVGPLAFAWMCGCGGTDGEGLIDSNPDAADDAAPSIDASADASSPDATLDAAPDATLDGGGDAGKDASKDASKDAPHDAPLDSPGDAPSDSPSDAPPDAPVEASGGCDAVAAPFHVHVDPNAGSDGAASTGSGTAGGVPSSACSAKTITHALTLLPSSAPAGAEVVVDVASTISAGETFPIPVPMNVEIRGAAGVVVTVLVPTGAAGFTFASTGSSLRDVIVDGQSEKALHGIVAMAGANAKIMAVDVTGFSLAGVRAEAGALTIGGGANLHDNGTSGAPAPGLRVVGTGVVTIAGGTAANPTRFSKNRGAGIDVEEKGSIQLTGAPASGALGTGTVVALQNDEDGVVIMQALTTLPPFPAQSSIDGIVSASNGGAGLRVFGGSALLLRNGVLVGNGDAGVRVAGNPNGGIGQDFDDIGRIDLGTSAISVSYGKNVLQDPTMPNQGVGLCLSLVDGAASVGQILRAAGNVFGPNLDCSTTNATLDKGTCTNKPKGTVGVTGTLDGVNVSMCRTN